MKLDKLTRKLSRDLTANPKKAGILGLMVVVALYFWFPLMKDWFGGSSTRTTAQASTVILTDDPEEPGGSVRKPKETLKWEKVRQWLDADPLMTSAPLNPTWSNPFVAPPQAPTQDTLDAEKAAEQLQAETKTVEDLDPQAAGLSVASVMIGPRLRAVTIGGEVYEEGALVPLASKDEPKIEFRLVAIEPTRIELERNGKRYELPFGRPKLAKGDRIKRSGETGQP